MSIGPTRKAASSIGPARELAGVGAIGLEKAVLDDDRQAEGHQQDRQNALSDGALQQETLQDVAGAEGDRDQDQRNEKRRPAKRAGQRQEHEREQHDHVAMGDVDEAHDAKRERQAEGEQRIEAADKHALDDEVDERLDHFAHAPK